jgi:DNA-binding IclR family transcriptional regulator
MEEERESKQGVQSLEIGMSILKVMVAGHRAMMLKDIAAAAGMSPPKAHRYLVSLIRAGLVEQDPLTSRYDIGPFALRIGLVAIDRLDRIRLGVSAITDLRDQTNKTVALAVWADRGPVIVRWERPRLPITVNVVTGVQLRLLSSGAGLVFAAWMPPKRIAPLIADELKSLKLPEDMNSKAKIESRLQTIRDNGLATISGGYFAEGVEAAGAPVFNFKGEISMAIIIVGVQGTLDMNPEGPLLTDLRTAARELSERLGYPGGVVQAKE